VGTGRAVAVSGKQVSLLLDNNLSTLATLILVG
jgi:hypothetical protein